LDHGEGPWVVCVSNPVCDGLKDGSVLHSVRLEHIDSQKLSEEPFDDDDPQLAADAKQGDDAVSNVAPDVQFAEPVRIDVDSERSGLFLDATTNALQVVMIKEGGVLDYNASASPECRVAEFDIIFEVNGETEPLKMLEAFANTQKKSFLVAHPVVIAVALNRAEQPLGMGLRFSEGSKCIEIDGIGVGTVKDHNDQAPAQSRVFCGDLIRSVNGVSGSVTDMLQELKSPGELRLELLRYDLNLSGKSQGDGLEQDSGPWDPDDVFTC
jgi:hypothetical protein